MVTKPDPDDFDGAAGPDRASAMTSSVGFHRPLPIVKYEPDPQQLREMLRAMQNGEMTVRRGVELVEMWTAGNYSDDHLPPIREGLGEDEMPWDRIDALLDILADLVAGNYGQPRAVHVPALDNARAALAKARP